MELKILPYHNRTADLIGAQRGVVPVYVKYDPADEALYDDVSFVDFAGEISDKDLHVGNNYRLAPYRMTPTNLVNKTVKLKEIYHPYVAVEYNGKDYLLHRNSLLFTKYRAKEKMMLVPDYLVSPCGASGNGDLFRASVHIINGQGNTISKLSTIARQIGEDRFRLLDDIGPSTHDKEVSGHVLENIQPILELTETGIPVRDDFDGKVIKKMCRAAALPNKDQLLEWAINQMKLFWGNTAVEAKKQVSEIYIASIGRLKDNVMDKLESAEEQYKLYKDHIREETARISRFTEQLATLTGGKPKLEFDVRSMLENGWSDFKVVGNFIIATTPFVTMEHKKHGTYNLGHYVVKINVDDISNNSQIYREAAPQSHDIHPHVFTNMRPCLGNAAETMESFYSSGNIQGVFVTIYNFLINYNASSPARGIHHFEQWKVLV